jgi:hypothetical protein
MSVPVVQCRATSQTGKQCKNKPSLVERCVDSMAERVRTSLRRLQFEPR